MTKPTENEDQADKHVNVRQTEFNDPPLSSCFLAAPRRSLPVLVSPSAVNYHEFSAPPPLPRKRFSWTPVRLQRRLPMGRSSPLVESQTHAKGRAHRRSSTLNPVFFCFRCRHYVTLFSIMFYPNIGDALLKGMCFLPPLELHPCFLETDDWNLVWDRVSSGREGYPLEKSEGHAAHRHLPPKNSFSWVQY